MGMAVVCWLAVVLQPLPLVLQARLVLFLVMEILTWTMTTITMMMTIRRTTPRMAITMTMMTMRCWGRPMPP